MTDTRDHIRRHELADEFSIIPQYSPNRLRVIHNPTDSQFNVYRRHKISQVLQGGGAYYYVEDMRGWEVGTANTLESLLEMLHIAVRQMSKLFAVENSDYFEMEPAQEGTPSAQERILQKVEESHQRIDSVINSLKAVPMVERPLPPHLAEFMQSQQLAPRRAIVEINGYRIETPLFVSLEFVREAARNAGVLPDSPAVLDAKAGEDEWIAIPESDHAAVFFQVPVQAHFRYMPIDDKA